MINKKTKRFSLKTVLLLAVIVIVFASMGFNTNDVHAKKGPAGGRYFGGIFLDGVFVGASHTVWTNSKNFKAKKIEGFSYSKKTNTLTIKNALHPGKKGDNQLRLFVQNMGDDFTIKLVGKNYLTAIEGLGYKYNTKINIVGPGTLYVNERRLGYSCVRLTRNAYLNISNTCTVKMYKSHDEPFVRVVKGNNSNKSKWFTAKGSVNKKIKFKYKKKDKEHDYTIKKTYVGNNGKKTFLSEKKQEPSNSSSSSSSNSSNNKKPKVEVKKYKISYDLNGGKNHKSNPSSYKTNSLPVKLHNATKKGYKFKGWYKNGKKVKKIAKKTTGNVKLTAKWKIKKYNLTCMDGATVVMKRKYTVKQTVGLPTGLTKKGKAFAGWYTSSIGGKKVTRVKKGSTGNILYYAHWKNKKDQTIKANDIVTYTSAGVVSLNASTTGDSKLRYTSSDAYRVYVGSDGKIVPMHEGIAKITITAPETYIYASKQKTILVTVNSSNLYKSFNITKKLPYLISTDKTRVMCPQGLCVVDNYVLVSAYQYKHAKDSAVYVLDGSGNYRGMINLGNNTAHVGGITSDGSKVFVSSEMKILYFSKAFLSRLSGGNEITLNENTDYQYVQNMHEDLQNSTLTYHKGALWVAKCEDKKVFELRAIPIQYSDGKVVAQNSVAKTLAFGAESVNGIVFESDSSDKLFVATSTGRFANSKLHYMNVTIDILKEKCPSLNYILDMPPMSEGMAIINGNLTTVYESSSNLYKIPYTEDNNVPAPYVMDYLTFFNLSNIG